MGSLGDNLLKLTEFPFSYSLIGLLALIFGEGLNLEEASLANLGPLLILMGFVATTLSITDPIGYLQKGFLGGFYAISQRWKRLSRNKETISDLQEGLEKVDYTGEYVIKYILKRRIFTISPIGSSVPLTVIMCLSRNYRDILDKIGDNVVYEKIIKHKTFAETYRRIAASKAKFSEEDRWWLGEIINIDDAHEIATRLIGLRGAAVGTTWIVREIDKITAMVYFVIIISLFIYAELFLTGFLDKVLISFQGSAEARIIILVFSIIALLAILFMLIIRHGQLRGKAETTFEFLIALEAIKIEKTTFDERLQIIEQHLGNGEWAMARYWVNRVINEYHDLLVGRKWVMERKEIRGEEAKDVERKIMIKWKNGEMSVEEVKDVENRVSTEQMKNVEQKNKE